MRDDQNLPFVFVATAAMNFLVVGLALFVLRPLRSRQLTASDWIRAATEVLVSDGVAAVAVEPIAERLGATKGSFYHHFENRDALIAAALQEWESAQTEAVIERLQLIRSDQHVAVGCDLVPLDDVLERDLVTGRRIDPLLADPGTGLARKLMKPDGLG